MSKPGEQEAATIAPPVCQTCRDLDTCADVFCDRAGETCPVFVPLGEQPGTAEAGLGLSSHTQSRGETR